MSPFLRLGLRGAERGVLDIRAARVVESQLEFAVRVRIGLFPLHRAELDPEAAADESSVNSKSTSESLSGLAAQA